MLENKGLIQSLALRAQRELVREVAGELKVPVLFLKAAWADPVLYGGEGKRHGTDIDVLVRPTDFESIALALEKRGFRRTQGLEGERGRYFEHKETCLLPPAGSAYLTIDLHRALTNPIWFDVATEALIARARTYEVGTEKIVSLSPEDQILHACLHYAGHAFDLDGRHLEDVLRLVSTMPIDWHEVNQRARETKTSTMLSLLQSALQGLGSGPLPVETPPEARWRAWAIRKLLSPDGQLRRQRPRSRWLDYLLVRPLMTDDSTAALRFARQFGLPWLVESSRNFRRNGG